MIEIPLHDFPENKLFFALNVTYKEVAYFLLAQNIPLMEVLDYMLDPTTGVKGKTTLFSNGLVFVRMYFLDRSIRRVSILMHEIIHASTKIVGDCSKQESVAYLADYIFEQIMKILQYNIDYTEEDRNINWLIDATHGGAD